jgi:hypothetical protein
LRLLKIRIYFALGLDSPDYTKSSPSGADFLRATPSTGPTEEKNLTRRANHRQIGIAKARASLIISLSPAED